MPRSAHCGAPRRRSTEQIPLPAGRTVHADAAFLTPSAAIFVAEGSGGLLTNRVYLWSNGLLTDLANPNSANSLIAISPAADRRWVRLYGFAGRSEDRGAGWYTVPLQRFPLPLVAKNTALEPSRLAPAAPPGR